MTNFEKYRYMDLLISKYLDKSVYTHNRVKAQMYLDIADRLLKTWITKYKLDESYLT